MIHDPRKNPDHQQNLNSSSLGRVAPLQKISLKAVYNFLRYFALAHMHTHRERKGGGESDK